jgi:hypothetical protein
MGVFVAEWRQQSLEAGFDGGVFSSELHDPVHDMWYDQKLAGPNPQSVSQDPGLNGAWNTFADRVDVGSRMHSAGVPVRWLGKLYTLVHSCQLQTACLKELLKRSAKAVLRERLRAGREAHLTTDRIRELISSSRSGSELKDQHDEQNPQQGSAGET